MIRYILFDMDGVLLNTEPLHYRLWQKVFAERGIIIDYEHYRGCIGSTYRRLCELILEGYGVDFRGDPSLIDRFHELKREYIQECGLPGIEGVAEVLPVLKAKGYRMAVASSSPQANIEYNMKHLGFFDYFEVLFSAERVARPKPAPDVFLEAARRLGASPEECVVIEDSENGSRAARAAGMYCLGFANPDSGGQDLSAANEIFYPFSELKGKIETLER